MNKIQEALQWISEHQEDKRDFTPQPPTHPVPSYVAEADKAEHEAWQAYMRVVQEELESGDDHETDYDRLQQAKEKWEQAADAQLEAHCGTYYHVHNQYTLSLNQSKSKNDNCDKVSNER
jgi:hypothetical protein